MRHRIEDFGRILYLIDTALDIEFHPRFMDDDRFITYFLPEFSDENEVFVERLQEMRLKMENLREILLEVWEIAKGEDILNKNIDTN